MGYRLSKIYTRTGDRGTTGLANGERVSKVDARIEALGTVDELSSALALILCTPAIAGAVRATLLEVQNTLFEVGAELSLPGHRSVAGDDVVALEKALDQLNAALPPLTDFILPGGPHAAAACHFARAVARRAERQVWIVAAEHTLNPALLQYLNRLSDYLFVAARSLTLDAGAAETLWRKRAPSD